MNIVRLRCASVVRRRYRLATGARCLSEDAHGTVFEQLRASRLDLVRRLPVVTHRIAGVTFENRQEPLQLLTRLRNTGLTTTVMLEKEPENPYDANAVAVRCCCWRVVVCCRLFFGGVL